METVEESLESLQSGTPEMDIDSLVNYLQDLRGGGSSPPQSGLITIDPSFYESGFVRSIVGQVVRYPASGRYVDMGDFQGYDHHCGAVCATNLMIYWNNRDDCKYKDLMYGSANDVFKGFYDKMGSDVWLPTFDSVVKSHFATYANGCSTNYTWFALIFQLSEMAKQKVISDGHRMAMYAASATMSAASAAREALNGLSACMVQKALAENFDAQYPDFLALCERFSKDSAVQSRVTFSLSTNKALDPAAILSAYPVGTPIPDAAPYVSDLPAKCAYRIPSQISFASLGYDYRRAGKVYSGIARVMSNILSLSYLWNEVRVQGGAYGAGLNTSETGRMVTYSYRDPSPARTLGINRSMSKGLRDFVAGDERIDKYIISTVGESEPPLGSENQILVSDENLLCGITPEDLCRERAEMLSTTKDALLKWCGVLDQMAKDGGVCVIGHDGAIAACEKEDLTVL